MAARLRPFLVVLIAAMALSCGTAAADDNWAGLVEIGDGRSLYLICQGHGSPTVFVIPGKGSYAEVWNAVVPADDPIRSSAYDLIAQARIQPSAEAVQPTVARTTRVCAYDRPGTRPDGPNQSTPVAQPRTVAQDVDDIVRLVSAAALQTPMVIAAHSYGGLIADLLARTHPEMVSGLVMVDPLSEFLPALGNPDQNVAFNRDARVAETPGDEGFLADESYAQISGAPPLPRVPAVVLSSDKFPPPSSLKPDNYTLGQIQQANTLLADALGTVNLRNTNSGHNVMLYQPQLVAAEIVKVVEKIRTTPQN